MYKTDFSVAILTSIFVLKTSTEISNNVRRRERVLFNYTLGVYLNKLEDCNMKIKHKFVAGNSQ